MLDREECHIYKKRSMIKQTDVISQMTHKNQGNKYFYTTNINDETTDSNQIWIVLGNLTLHHTVGSPMENCQLV